MMKPAGWAHAADHGKRLVIKIGSSTLTTSESKIDYAYLAEVTDQVARVQVRPAVGRVAARQQHRGRHDAVARERLGVRRGKRALPHRGGRLQAGHVVRALLDA